MQVVTTGNAVTPCDPSRAERFLLVHVHLPPNNLKPFSQWPYKALCLKLTAVAAACSVSSSQLTNAIKSYGVDCRGCIEKADLVHLYDRLQQASLNMLHQPALKCTKHVLDLSKRPQVHLTSALCNVGIGLLHYTHIQLFLVQVQDLC